MKTPQEVQAELEVVQSAMNLYSVAMGGLLAGAALNSDAGARAACMEGYVSMGKQLGAFLKARSND